MFNKLSKQHIERIVDKFIKDINDLLSDKHISVRVRNDAVDEIIDKGYDSKMGARPLARKINELIKVPLSKKILFENLQNCTVYVDFINGEFDFDVRENEYILYPTNKAIDENGYVVLDEVKSNL